MLFAFGGNEFLISDLLNWVKVLGFLVNTLIMLHIFQIFSQRKDQDLG